MKIVQLGQPADCVTVFEALKSSGLDAEVGGFAYLAELANNATSAANIRRYAEIVHDKAVLRQLIVVGDKMVTNALAPEGRETRDILDEAEKTCSRSTSAIPARKASARCRTSCATSRSASSSSTTIGPRPT